MGDDVTDDWSDITRCDKNDITTWPVASNELLEKSVVFFCDNEAELTFIADQFTKDLCAFHVRSLDGLKRMNRRMHPDILVFRDTRFSFGPDELSGQDQCKLVDTRKTCSLASGVFIPKDKPRLFLVSDPILEPISAMSAAFHWRGVCSPASLLRRRCRIFVFD